VTDDGELLGAHVSSLGGLALAPARGAAIGATAMQVFTKTPQQWREPAVSAEEIAAFRQALVVNGIHAVVSHESYLNNLASPDPALRDKSARAFTRELERCRAYGIRWVVTHPGNYMDERASGLARNARGYAECLAAVPGDVGLLIEGTAGAGTAPGSCGRSATRFPSGSASVWRFAWTRLICTLRGTMWSPESKRYGSSSIGRSGSPSSSACISTIPRGRPGLGLTAMNGSARARWGPDRFGTSCGTRDSRG